jgi:hypothetical protein
VTGVRAADQTQGQGQQGQGHCSEQSTRTRTCLPERATRGSRSNAKVRNLSPIVHVHKLTFGCGRVSAVSRGQANLNRPDVVRITVAVRAIATAAHDGERNCFIYPVESRGKFAGKTRGENSRGKFAWKNRGENSRGKSNHISAAGSPGAWVPDPN